MRASTLLLPFLVLAAACGGDSNGNTEDTVEVEVEVTTDVIETIDLRPETSAPETEVVLPTGDFGEACLGNPDCESGWCVEGPEGYICTSECLESCPDGYDCKSVQNAKGDVTFLCLPRVLKLCVSCLEDSQCNGGTCLEIAGSKQCASGCDPSEEDPCPEGYACEVDATGAKEGNFCQPVSGSCDCSPPFEGVTRLCTNTNELGTCRGAETCDPSVGWVDCTALVPVTEACDFTDNDCDTEVDEDFKTDGVYATPDNCGSCGLKCADVLANAAETACVVESGTARCQVITCAPGYTRLNPFVCAPESSSLCQPCITAAECLGTEAACTELDDGDFCTLPCNQDADCATGFTCEDTDNGLQCVPDSGSCTCDGSNTNLARSCTQIYTPADPNQPVVTCKGFEQCTTTGWGGCDLPDDACDGIDNDCDGVVDGPHKTGDRYTSIEHCGACGISCLAFVRDNAAPVCDTSSVVPQCGYECAGGAVDVNGLGDDGCECVPVAGPDLAGDSIDSNCDGVDGEVNNAIFVSKDGIDGNPGTRDLPVLSVQVGIDRARDGNKRDVYVATGVYSQSIVLAEGVGVFGGYAPEFDQHDVLLYETAIIGGNQDSTHPGTVSAFNIGTGARDTVIDGFTIFGVNAGNIPGGNSYGIYVRNSSERLRISNNRVFGGPGGGGENGQRGVDGPPGVDGAPGTAAKNLSTDCSDADESAGGAGGVQQCGPAQANVSGGRGGRAICPEFGVQQPLDVVAEMRGALGQGTGVGNRGEYGSPFFICADNDGCTRGVTQYEAACSTCHLPGGPYNPTSGGDGASGANGIKGNAGASAGTITNWEWTGGEGGKGGDGENNGGGGGGGGAASGVEVDGLDCSVASNDDVGGSGGGGGSGGCLGTGGFGGKAGGGSFGIFIVGTDTSKTPILRDNTVISGRGGAGGAGGAGGVGGAGGAGGAGGSPGDQNASTKCAAGGGNGGNGGSGGHGGGGGGGSGGPSYGIFVRFNVGSFSAPGTWTGNSASHGDAGAGGIGGGSIDPTNSGTNGATGEAANTNY